MSYLEHFILALTTDKFNGGSHLPGGHAKPYIKENKFGMVHTNVNRWQHCLMIILCEYGNIENVYKIELCVKNCYLS